MSCELVFIIPLKSAKVSADWERTQEILRTTLLAVNAQPNCKAIVVCNEIPDVDAHIVQVDFLPPDRSADELRNDKCRKCHVGLQHAAQFSPKRAMILDADDLVHKDLVEHVSRFDPSIGLLMKHGYRYTLGSSFVRRSFRFHYLTASTMIFPYTTEIGETYRDYYMTRQSHPKPIERLFRKAGIKYKYLDFPGGVYLRGTNDSLRDVRAVQMGKKAQTRAWRLKWFRLYGRKLLGKLFFDYRITDQHLRDFPGLEVYVGAKGV